MAGHPATYDATAVDAWSPGGDVLLDLRRRRDRDERRGHHAFAEPGKYTVRFRVTDAVGNSSVRVARTKVIAAPAFAMFTLAKRRITLADKARIRIGLNVPAKVKLVLRSKQRHRVDGVLHRQKLVLKRELDAGTSTVVLKGSRLLADTWVRDRHRPHPRRRQRHGEEAAGRSRPADVGRRWGSRTPCARPG